MKINKSVQIDDLFEKTKNYDQVLTVEAPLADALNNRLKRPNLGEFATTPKRLSYNIKGKGKIANERELFIKIVQETNLSWKQIFYLLENILNCWKNTGSLHKILEHKQFDNETTMKIITIIEKTPNVYSAMENFESNEKKSTAVIAPYQFNELDRKTLPPEYDVVEVFEDEKRKLSKFNIFGTVTDILQTIKNTISKENAEDVGIVVEAESGYTPLIKSLLRSENIPFMLGRSFSENEDLRTILLILKYGLSRRRLLLRDVQPILRSIDTGISIEHNKEFLEDLEFEELNEIKKLLSNIPESKLGDIIREYENLTGRNVTEVREELENLGINNEKITEENVNKLEYYLDSFDIQVGGSERGVLLASPKTSSFVDRPIVLYLGMDSNWEHTLFEKPWINKEKLEERNLKNFELLLQNGEHQHFLVRNSDMGSYITPCLYFDEILEEEFDNFTDLPHEKYSDTVEEKVNAFEKKDYGIDVKSVKTISQSSLNKLVKCPKEYFFSKLVSMEDEEYLKMGSLFHDFAEFYVNDPKFVEDKSYEDFIDLMVKELKPFTEDFMVSILRTKIRIGINNLTKYLEMENPNGVNFEEYEKKSWDNFFADHFDKSVKDEIAEAWFEDLKLGAKGKVDLIKNEKHLVDYKSGKRKSSKSIVKNSNIELFDDEPNFQSILYLAHHRMVRPDEKLKFSFFYFLDNLEEVISGKANIKDDFVTITYHPNPFTEQVSERETFDHLIEGVSENNDRRKTLEKLGYSNYRSFFEYIELPTGYDKNELLSSELAQEYISYGQKKVGNYKYVKDGCKSALKKLCGFRVRNYFKEDLDNFDDFLKEQLQKLNEYKRKGFPIGDTDLDKLENRDLILGDTCGTK